MNDLNFEIAKKDMEGVIGEHFPPSKHPHMSEEVVAGEAEKLVRSFLAARTFEALERADKRPDKDIQNLKVAARNLKLATERLEQVGRHGQKHLGAVLDEAFNDPLNEGFTWHNSGHHAHAYLIGHIETLQQGILEASRSVDSNGAPLVDTLTGDPGTAGFNRKTPEKSAARFFARECARLFEQSWHLGMGRQNVVHSWQGDGTRAAFQRFLSAALETVHLKANSARLTDEIFKPLKEK